MDPQFLQEVEDKKAAFDQAVTANAAAANTVTNDQQAVSQQTQKVAAAQALLDQASAQVATDQTTLTSTQAAVRQAALDEVATLQALIASLAPTP